MHYERQKYKDLPTPADANPFDCFQRKYDGHWTRLEVGEVVNLYSRTGKLKDSWENPTGIRGVFFGERMFGNQFAKQREDLYGKYENIYLFDCLEVGTERVSLMSVPYSIRYEYLHDVGALMNASINDRIRVVETYYMTDENDKELFIEQVRLAGWEGVVVRHSTQTAKVPIHRYKFSFQKELTITGFEPGCGRLNGSLGAVTGIDSEGVTMLVGGGFSDELRRKIWHNQAHFLGQKFIAEGRGIFDSGSLRHPNFITFTK